MLDRRGSGPVRAFHPGGMTAGSPGYHPGYRAKTRVNPVAVVRLINKASSTHGNNRTRNRRWPSGSSAGGSSADAVAPSAVMSGTRGSQAEASARTISIR